MKKLYFWGKRLSLATLTLMLGLLLLASCSKQPTDTPVPSAPVYTLNKDNAYFPISVRVDSDANSTVRKDEQPSKALSLIF